MLKECKHISKTYVWGQDNYEIPHTNLQNRLMEVGDGDADTLYSIPTESVVATRERKTDPYYSIIPDQDHVAKYININADSGQAPRAPHQWDTDVYDTTRRPNSSTSGESGADPYTVISLEGEEDFYSHTMHGFGGEAAVDETI